LHLTLLHIQLIEVSMDNARETSYTLIERACDLGDEEAWRRIHDHYRAFIIFILKRLSVKESDLDDLVQQVLVILMRDIGKYDKSKGRFRSWFIQLIRTTVLMHFRKVQSFEKLKEVFSSEEEVRSCSVESVIDKIIEEEWGNYISTTALKRIEKSFSGNAIDVFKMSMKGFSVSEICTKLDLQESSVYTLKKRVKKMMVQEVNYIVTNLEPS